MRSVRPLVPALCATLGALAALAVALLATSRPAAAGSREELARGSGPDRNGGGPGAFTLSGPYTHDNLTVYLIHGKDRIDLTKYLTLQEALEQKKVVVHETGNVNELSIENVSAVPVYVQSGDIVKGGRQDRTIASDFICPPHSGKMPIDAFCVEHGRWQQRGGESPGQFASSNAALSSRELKLAAKQAGSQQEVWKEAANAQAKLSSNVGADVKDKQSQSSYQLSLENKQLQATTEAYIKELNGIVESKDDVIGYAFAINGRINSADVYAASGLFRKMWPKLIRSAAVEAIAEYQKDKKFEPVTADAVRAFLADAEAGKKSVKPAGDKLDLVTEDGKAAVLFETQDKENKGEWLHRNYIRK
jgi:hypothetical protein